MKNYIIKVDLKTPISLSHLGGLFRDYGLLSNCKTYYDFKKKIFLINLNIDCNVNQIKTILLNNNQNYLKNNDCDVYEFNLFKDLNPEIIKLVQKKEKDFFKIEFDDDEKYMVAVGRMFMKINPMFSEDDSKKIRQSCKNISELITKSNISYHTSFFEKIKKRFIKEDVKLNPVINVFINEEKNVINLENLDDILEKISSKGIHTLTDKEINCLNNYTDTI
jgi:hypothetical protein